MHSKWFGKGGAGPATKGRKGIYFHGVPEKEAAEYHLSIPNAKADNQWATTHGKGGKWKNHASKIVPVADTNDLPPFAEFLPLCPGLLQQGSSSMSTPAESPPPSESNSDNEDTNCDILFTSDLITEARQQLMQLCVSIIKTQLGPDKDLGKLSLLWLQRAQASQEGAVAHFMQQLIKSNAIDTAITAHKSLTASLNDNAWKHVFETRDLLRTENLTASIALGRSSKAHTALADKNSQLQARVEQLESTVNDLNSTNKKSLKLVASLEKKLVRLQDDKDSIQTSLGTCCQSEGNVISLGRGVVHCKFCVTGLREWGGETTTWNSDDHVHPDEEDRAAAKTEFCDEALREAEEMSSTH